MKEQCLEELKKNTSIPSDLVDQINNAICINKCSYQGDCVKGQRLSLIFTMSIEMYIKRILGLLKHSPKLLLSIIKR